MDKKPRWLTIRSVSTHLGISDRGVYRLAAEGSLIAAKFRGSVRILANSLEHYEKACLAQYALENGIGIEDDENF